MLDTFFLLHVIVTRASCNIPADLLVVFELNLINGTGAAECLCRPAVGLSYNIAYSLIRPLLQFSQLHPVTWCQVYKMF